MSTGDMDTTQLCKLFIGGLNVQTTEEGLRQHFETYGQLTDCVVVINPQTKRSRCFGFVTYSSAAEADAAVEASPHVVDGNNVELKRAVSREDSAKPGAHAKVKKLFVGGLKEDVGESDLLEHFAQFGAVEKVEIIADKVSGKKRGFGFVYFTNHDSADKAAVVKFHSINGHRVEVKKAVPKEELSQGSNRSFRGGRGGRGRGGGGAPRDYNGIPGSGGKAAFGGGYGGYGGGNQGYGSYGGGYGEQSDYGNGYNSFGSYSQHQSSYGPMKGAGSGSWNRPNTSGPYRGGYSGGGGGGYGVGSSYGGGSF
ncbi:heterogeneous nuclear ribonucleoprotein A0 [Xenopus tropicalis]|uniref:Heterogeneous nuclear ribonucleoprotein A0 n=1 Tax=Xenopus tropicalis TaxID=8364 RepID=Q6PBD5_XENTR|eukprot:NP_988923.1 heterogeneous nuclear ribonucleoprotein A0 [Xenopus tropicalis]